MCRCEKECLSVPGIRRLFWVVFFLLAVHLVAIYGRKPISQPQKNRISRHWYTKVRFPRKNPPFYLKHVLKLRPCVEDLVLRTATDGIAENAPCRHQVTLSDLELGKHLGESERLVRYDLKTLAVDLPSALCIVGHQLLEESVVHPQVDVAPPVALLKRQW